MPWFILVPETDLPDLLDLAADDRAKALSEAAAVSAFGFCPRRESPGQPARLRVSSNRSIRLIRGSRNNVSVCRIFLIVSCQSVRPWLQPDSYMTPLRNGAAKS